MTKESLSKKIKQELDELKLQAKLGKAEASDFIEEKKEEFDEFIDQTKDRLQDSVAAEEKMDLLHQKLDDLKLQLTLGRMEAKDAYDEQKEKIENAIDSTRHELHEIEAVADGVLGKARAAFDHKAGAFTTKVQLLARHWKKDRKDDEDQDQVTVVMDTLSAGIDTEDLGAEHPHRIHKAWKKLKADVHKIVEG